MKDKQAMRSADPTQSATSDGVSNVSVVIPSFERKDQLLKTLKKIAACTPRPREILVHLDSGWDLQLEEALSDNSIPIRLFRSKECLGPGGGRDLLIRKATCEYVASFDDDSFPVNEDYFAKVVRIFSAAPDAAILAAKITNPATPRATEHVAEKYLRDFTGCGVVYRKSAYLSSLGYVPLPIAYAMEEVDLSLQFRCLGYRILSAPALQVLHDPDPHTIRWREVNAATIKNQALLPFLRYPILLWPVGFLQWIRRLVWNLTSGRISGMLTGILGVPSYLWKYRRYRHTLPLKGVWKYLMFRFSPEKRETEEVPGMPSGPGRAPPHQRILYVQFTNPGAYPPLEHSARLLGDRDWDVTFLGTESYGGDDLDFTPHPRITVLRRKFYGGGWRQKTSYIFYCLWVLHWLRREDPAWLYCSDPLSCIPGLLAKRFGRARLVYHEHDRPDTSDDTTLFFKYVLSARQSIAQKADVVVIPNQARLDDFREETEVLGKSHCVWNCPTREEVAPSKKEPSDNTLRLVYHGTIVPYRLPLSLLEAMHRSKHDIFLSIAGYVTVGHKSYLKEFLEKAAELGLAEKVTYTGAIPERADLLAHARQSDVGLSLMPTETGDSNARQMLGASNKPFDYLSQGLPVLVSRLRDWEEMFVSPGFGLSCDPEDAGSLAASFQQLAESPLKRIEMGEKGRQKILQEWNYETQFAPVLEDLQTEAPRS